MKGLFGITKLKDKLQAQKFSFIVTIHNLQPWPDTGNRSVAIGWQRGKEKRGATRSVYPSPQPGKVGNVARFNEKFELSATLYKVRHRARKSLRVAGAGARQVPYKASPHLCNVFVLLAVFFWHSERQSDGALQEEVSHPGHP